MGIPYTKTAEDNRIEQYDLQNNKTLKHLRDLTAYKFAIGDVLIREDKIGYGTNEKWQINTAQCGLPYKYVYVFENQLGVGYIRRLSINGGDFVEQPICVVEFDPSTTRFRLDPDYADHIILSGADTKFDLKSDYKAVRAKRNAMHRANAKIREITDTDAQALAFLGKLKVGDQVWSSWSKSKPEKEPYTVTKIDLTVPPPPPANSNYGWNGYSSYGRNQTYNLELSFMQYGSKRESRYNLHDITRRYWYRVRPQFLDELL